MQVEKKVKCGSLENGLKVCVYEMDSPKAAVQIWFGAGAAEEDKGYAGIAHVFEHMMFKGTKHRKLGEVAKDIEEVGGNMNAYTSYDYTAYVVNLPAREVERAVDVLADISRFPTFPEDELKKEIEVIVEEYRRGEDLPEGKLWKETLSFVFRGHPYGVPVVGWPRTIRKVTRGKLFDFMEKWYRPDNALLVVAGGVKYKRVMKLAEKYFGDWKEKGESPERAAEKPNFSWRDPIYLFYKKDLQEPRFVIAYPGVSLADVKETAVYDVLAAALGGANSSRLVKRLRIQRPYLTSVHASSWSPRQQGAFFITGVLKGGEEEKGFKALLRELDAFARTGPSREEFENARESLIKGIISSFESSEQVAETMGEYFAEAGDPNVFFKYLKALQDVSYQDVLQIAHKLFASKPAIVFMAPEASSIKKADVRKWASNFLKKERAAEVKVKEGKYGVKEVTFSCGLKGYFLERPDTQTVFLTLLFHGGVSAEEKGKEGVGWMTASLLKRGTKFHSAQEISSLEDKYFTMLQAHVNLETFSVRAEFLKKDFSDAVQVFSEILLDPAFSDSELEKVRKDQLALLRKEKENPFSRLIHKIREVMYPQHPYAGDVFGTEESVKKLQVEDVLKYYRKVITARNGILVMTGDFKTEDVVDMLDLYFSRMSEGSVALSTPLVEKVHHTQVAFEPMDTKQAHLAMVFYAPDLKDEKRYPMEIVESSLSGMSGRLFMDLRDMRALAYSVTALYRPRERGGIFILYMATAPQKVKEALKGFYEEVENLRKSGLSKGEIERAQKYIVGNYQMGFETNQAVGLRLSYTQLLTGDYTRVFTFQHHINSVSDREIRRVILDYLEPSSYAIVIVGPERAAEEAKKFFPGER